MKNLKSVNHIGYAVKERADPIQHYINAGWTMSDIFEEEIQNTKIVFLTKEGFPK